MKPPFLSFQGTTEDLFLEVALELENNANKLDPFWKTKMYQEAETITKEILFEAVSFAFFNKHDINIERHGKDIESNNGFFDFHFPNMVETDIHFEYVGGEGTCVCTSDDWEFVSCEDVFENARLECLNHEQKTDLALYIQFLDSINIADHEVIYSVARPDPKTSMKKKHKAFYPLMERRLLAGGMKTSKPTAPKKM